MDYIATYVKAPHDSNGNPQRGYLVYGVNTGKVQFFDQDFRGPSFLPEELEGTIGYGAVMEVTKKEYKKLKSEYSNYHSLSTYHPY